MPSGEGNVFPIDIFLQFLSDDILEMIVQETNRFAQQIIESAPLTRKSRLNSWIPMTKSEFKIFLGLVIYMGLVPLPEISLYWSEYPIS